MNLGEWFQIVGAVLVGTGITTFINAVFTRGEKSKQES